MRKIILILILSIISISLFASSKRSLSTNVSIMASSFALEYKVNDSTQVSIPFGMNIFDSYGEEIPPVYAGLLIEHELNEYIPGKNSLQLKVGYGVAYIYNFNDLTLNGISIHAFIPVISGQLELHVSENHSLYLRSTPPLGAIYYDNRIRINTFNSENILDYIATVEILSLGTLSIGYRYTYE